MTEKITLAALFKSRKNELERQLEGLYLPKDAGKVQQIIAEYLNNLFDSDGEFRQSLTQSEDYMLQAVLSLLNAQQEMSGNLINQIAKIKPRVDVEKGNDNSNDGVLNIKMTSIQSLIGSAGGALVGKMILGGWGAVFGAIAGTGIAVYIASRYNQPAENTDKVNVIYDEQLSSSNITGLITILARVCSSVDDMIATFRAQINKVANKYELQDKPSIEKLYLPVIENIQSLIGYSRAHPDDEKFVRKIRERIEDLGEILEMYNLTIVDYSETGEALFEKIASPNTDKPKMVYPAIMKGDTIVLKGKIFVPEQ